MPWALLLHDLALLGLTVAHGADGEVHRDELRAMWAELEAWAPGRDPALVKNVLREAALSYANGLDDERLGAMLGRLRAGLGEEERARVVAGLRAIAAADGVVRPAEEALVAHVAAVLA
jgi:uncharacterized tellurite resistance protein B-like protein